MGREITNVRSCDVMVIVGGRTGTLGELAIAYDEGRLVGVLSGTGCITALVDEIVRASGKQTGARVVYDDDPEALIERVVHVYRTQHFRKPPGVMMVMPSKMVAGVITAVRYASCGNGSQGCQGIFEANFLAS